MLEWSALKKLIWSVGSPILNGGGGGLITIVGNIVRFLSRTSVPIEKLVVSISPTQDTHGFAPYPAGASNNIIPDGTDTNNGYIYGYYLKSDGTMSASKNWYVSEYFPITEGETYTWSGNYNASSVSICFYDSNKTFISGIAGNNELPKTFTAPTNAAYCRATQGLSFNLYEMQIEQGSTATTIKPYSNICPILAWTETNIYHTHEYHSKPLSLVSVSHADDTTADVKRVFGAGTIQRTGTSTGNSYVNLSTSLKAGGYIFCYEVVGASAEEQACWTGLSSSLCYIGIKVGNGSTTYMRTLSGYAFFGVQTDGQTFTFWDAVKSGASVTGTIKYAIVKSEDYVLGEVPDYIDPPTYTISWQSEAGNIYGGDLTIYEDGSATLVKKYATIMGGSKTWTKVTGNDYRNFGFDWNGIVQDNDTPTVWATCYKGVCTNNGATSDADNYVWVRASDGKVWVKDTSKASMTENQFKTAMENVRFVALFKKSNWTTYNLTAEELTTFVGENCIMADAGDVSVTAEDIRKIV